MVSTYVAVSVLTCTSTPELYVLPKKNELMLLYVRPQQFNFLFLITHTQKSKSVGVGGHTIQTQLQKKCSTVLK